MKLGDLAIVQKVSSSVLACKLTEMGLYPGKEIKILFKAPLGDPIGIEVGDYTLSLRKKEAALIEVTVGT
ncbi:FeoA family protein [Fulvivirgaceae bacterium BMA10]|uniref:FeoA family protein n=1 Tax=Splendidivirga corallicola TaxID=3051826 RepID=A0ABT8KPU5_9BACT|nr:FeoA family protein [Fulvivirgaceae bacterium BMA10]